MGFPHSQCMWNMWGISVLQEIQCQMGWENLLGSLAFRRRFAIFWLQKQNTKTYRTYRSISVNLDFASIMFLRVLMHISCCMCCKPFAREYFLHLPFFHLDICIKIVQKCVCWNKGQVFFSTRAKKKWELEYLCCRKSNARWNGRTCCEGWHSDVDLPSFDYRKKMPKNTAHTEI